MRWNPLTCLLLFATTAVSAQIVPPRPDVMGPHLNFGRGCGSCHLPHDGWVNEGIPQSGAAKNGVTRTSATRTGALALWGEDVTGFYDQVTQLGRNRDAWDDEERDTPDVRGLTGCLSCHDGNYASPAMMRNRIYEQIPGVSGTSDTIPTLYGENDFVARDFLSNHPVGLTASIKCGGQEGWDCKQSEGVVVMKGARSSQFVKDYGFFVKPAEYNNTAVVVCTTCHEPHRRNVFGVGPGSRSGLPPGNYATMFFLRGPYNAGSADLRSDSASQFCRQCHAAQSNEMNGVMVATAF